MTRLTGGPGKGRRWSLRAGLLPRGEQGELYAVCRPDGGDRTPWTRPNPPPLATQTRSLIVSKLSSSGGPEKARADATVRDSRPCVAQQTSNLPEGVEGEERGL